MEHLEDSNECRLWGVVAWVLRATVAFQCLGIWRLLVRVEESPLMALFWDQPDVGGWGWSEQTALATQYTVGWLVLVAGLCVLVRPCAVVLAPLVLLQLTIAVTMCLTDSGYPLQIDWLPLQLTTWFPLATQSSRIAAPLGLLLLDPWYAARPLVSFFAICARGTRMLSGERPTGADHSNRAVARRGCGPAALGEKRIAWGIGVLRWCIALTFLTHGLESWQHNPIFVDLLISSSQQLLGLDLAQQSAETMLSIIGVVDILAAVACVWVRWKSVLWWMVFWGTASAVSRIVANGWDMAWHGTLMRSAHTGVPLAVVLHWHWLQYRVTKPETKTQEDYKIPAK